MTKNIVICCDGTGNEIGTTISNVLKIFRMMEKSDQQRVYYIPGVGTIGDKKPYERWKQKLNSVFRLATGTGIDADVLSGYRFLCENYEDGDRVWLFGFSRGAYAVRILAAFTHVIGVLPPDQLNLAGFALAAYKESSYDIAKPDNRPGAGGAFTENATGDDRQGDKLRAAWHFRRVAGGRLIPIEFIGVWDTVASVIVPRPDRLLPQLQFLRFTRTNPSVKAFRQAIAIDERRRMFRLNKWRDPQSYRPNPFDAASGVKQDVHQMWFAGVHGDIGGGYPEVESALSKYPLKWMVDEADAKGLQLNRAMVDHLIYGCPTTNEHRQNAEPEHRYVAPDFTGCLHNSMTLAWKLIEWWPKQAKWREWPKRKILLGRYIPWCEPRLIPEDADIHPSVFDRINAGVGYDPVNVTAVQRNGHLP